MNPSQGAIGEKGSQAPNPMMTAVVTVNGQLAQLCRKGIRLVRMTWMMSVCVSSDSTNQPVWNSDALCSLIASVAPYHFQQPKTHHIMA